VAAEYRRVGVPPPGLDGPAHTVLFRLRREELMVTARRGVVAVPQATAGVYWLVVALRGASRLVG